MLVALMLVVTVVTESGNCLGTRDPVLDLVTMCLPSGIVDLTFGNLFQNSVSLFWKITLEQLLVTKPPYITNI